MLGFFRFGTMCAALAGGFALLGVFGGCGPSAGTCSGDNHTVLDPSGNTIATCPASQACSTSGGTAGCVACDPTQCLKGDSCIQGWQNYDDATKGDMSNQTTECRLTCKAPTDCPFNYHCFDPGAGAQAYCVKDRASATFTPTSMGEAAGGAPWGVPCSPTHGAPDAFASNSDCDSKDNFWCYGISPTDANSFCTQFQCGSDGDCPGGWWCATINDSPNVTTARRGLTVTMPPSTYNWGSTTTVCLPRAYNLTPGTYCAPCKSDVECPTNNGNPQHCVPADGMSSKETICAVECTADSNCPLDYHCGSANGQMVCLPRAATCVGSSFSMGAGKNQFCDPCHSDTDCSSIGGFCTLADYSTEHFCTAATPTCTCTSGSGCMDTCPPVPAGAKPPNTTTDGEACTADTTTGLPAKQCYAGGQFGLGCYTYHCASTGGSCSQNSDCCSNKCDTSTNPGSCL